MRKVIGQISVHEMYSIYLAGMASCCVGDVKVLGITRACKLDQHLVGRVILVVAPIDLALTELVPPVHCPVIALYLN